MEQISAQIKKLGNKPLTSIKSWNRYKTLNSLCKETGVEIALITDVPPLDESDFYLMLAKLSLNFKINFAEINTVNTIDDNGNPVQKSTPSSNFLLVKDIFDRCQELQWSKEEFKHRLEWFLDNHVWDNFKRAHFINGFDRPKLYPYAWYLQEYYKNPNADFEGYEVPTTENKTIVLYKYVDGNIPFGLKKVFPRKVYQKAITIAEALANARAEVEAEESKKELNKI